MKRIALAVVLLMSIQLVAQSKPTSAASKPKVRAITGFVRLDQGTYEKQIADALVVLRMAKSCREKSRAPKATTIHNSQPATRVRSMGRSVEPRLPSFLSHAPM